MQHRDPAPHDPAASHRPPHDATGLRFSWWWLCSSTIVAVILCNLLGGATLHLLRAAMEQGRKGPVIELNQGIVQSQPTSPHSPPSPPPSPHMGQPDFSPGMSSAQQHQGHQSGPSQGPEHEKGSPFTPFLVFALVVSLAMAWYERPVRAALARLRDKEPIPGNLEITAQRRSLNLPYAAMGLNLSLGLAMTAFAFWRNTQRGQEHAFLQPGPLEIFMGTMVVAIFGFILLELLVSRYRARLFFPQGRLEQTPGVLRITLLKRFLILFLALTLMPCLVVQVITLRASIHEGTAEQALTMQITAFTVLVPIFTLAGFGLVLASAMYLSGSLKRMARALRQIASGDYHGSIRVVTNDEMGFVGDKINEMTEGLRDRERMRTSLNLAQRVQQRLMPAEPPDVKGYEIAGKSVYCDEMGGDYFDYLTFAKDPNRFGVAQVDVSGHGVESALYMATVRAYLRQRAPKGGGPGRIITDVNDQMASDMAQSGSFATCFYCEFDLRQGVARWVRAGHDPALMCNGGTGEFQELKGVGGLPLGVLEGFAYQEEVTDFPPGSMLAMGTDGIWERLDPEGREYGHDRYVKLFKKHCLGPAKTLVKAVYQDILTFSGDIPEVDDVTLVVVRREAMADS